MNFAQSITEKIASLPENMQQEVSDFVDFMIFRKQVNLKKNNLHSEWTNNDFVQFSMQQAFKDIEDDPIIYTVENLKERWL